MYSVRVFVISMETSNLHTIRSDCCVKKPGIPVTEQYILEHYLYCQEVKTEMVFLVYLPWGWNGSQQHIRC